MAMSLPSFAEMGVPPPLQPQQGQFEQPQQHHDAATVTNTAKGINGVKHDAAKPVDNASPRPPSYNAYLETPRPKTRLQTVAAYRRCDFYNEWHSSDRIALFHCWPIEYWLNGRSRLARFLREGHRLGSPSYGLAPLPGDVILKTHRGARWTRNWGWCLSWKLATNPLYSNWYISVTAVSKTRPCFGKQKGICFSEANLDPGMQRWETTHTRGFRCRRIWAFTSREALPQVDRTWMAEVRLYLRDSSQLQNLDFRSLLTARNTALFKIDQRVSSKRYKKVVLWQKNGVCGNDLVGQGVQYWTDDMPERLAEFASSIMTLG